MISDDEDDDLQLNEFSLKDELSMSESSNHDISNAVDLNDSNESQDLNQLIQEIINCNEQNQEMQLIQSFSQLNKRMQCSYVDFVSEFNLNAFSLILFDILQNSIGYLPVLHLILEYFSIIFDVKDNNTNKYKLSEILINHSDQNGNYSLIFQLIDIIHHEINSRMQKAKQAYDNGIFTQIFDLIIRIFNHSSLPKFPLTRYVNLIQSIISVVDFTSENERCLAIRSILFVANVDLQDSNVDLLLDFIKTKFDLIQPITMLEIIEKLNWKPESSLHVLKYLIYQGNPTFNIIMGCLNDTNPQVCAQALHTLSLLSFEIPNFQTIFGINPLEIVAERIGDPNYSDACLDIIQKGLKYPWVLKNLISIQIFGFISQNYDSFCLNNKNIVVDIIAYLIDKKIDDEAFPNEMKQEFVIPNMIDYTEMISDNNIFNKLSKIFLCLFDQDQKYGNGCISKFIELDGPETFVNLAERLPQLSARIYKYLDLIKNRFGIEY